MKFTGIPNFAPEHFRRVRLKNPLKMKQLQKGLLQLAEEGAVQVFRPLVGSDYIMGAVGVLQFEVTMARLQDEYGVEAVYEPVRFPGRPLGPLRRQEGDGRIRTPQSGYAGL